jgi:hypothetical protein
LLCFGYAATLGREVSLGLGGSTPSLNSRSRISGAVLQSDLYLGGRLFSPDRQILLEEFLLCNYVRQRQ